MHELLELLKNKGWKFTIETWAFYHNEGYEWKFKSPRMKEFYHTYAIQDEEGTKVDEAKLYADEARMAWLQSNEYQALSLTLDGIKVTYLAMMCSEWHKTGKVCLKGTALRDFESKYREHLDKVENPPVIEHDGYDVIGGY